MAIVGVVFAVQGELKGDGRGWRLGRRHAYHACRGQSSWAFESAVHDIFAKFAEDVRAKCEV